MKTRWSVILILSTVFIVATFCVLALMTSCGVFTGQNVKVERDTFLTTLPMMNNEILGELKYDDPGRDLTEMQIQSYEELYDKVEPTADYKKAISFIKNHMHEVKITVERETFIICLKSLEIELVLCDDADTPGIDEVQTGTPVPDLAGILRNVHGPLIPKVTRQQHRRSSVNTITNYLKSCKQGGERQQGYVRGNN